MGWIKDLFDEYKAARKKRIEDKKASDELYQSRIRFYREELEFTQKFIKDTKELHPENGRELDIWKAEAEKGYLDKVALNEEIRNLREKVIFLERELEMTKRKKRGMYE